MTSTLASVFFAAASGFFSTTGYDDLFSVLASFFLSDGFLLFECSSDSDSDSESLPDSELSPDLSDSFSDPDYSESDSESEPDSDSESLCPCLFFYCDKFCKNLSGKFEI